MDSYSALRSMEKHGINDGLGAEIIRRICALVSMGASMASCWIREHADLEGDEQAEDQAGEAMLHANVPEIPFFIAKCALPSRA